MAKSMSKNKKLDLILSEIEKLASHVKALAKLNAGARNEGSKKKPAKASSIAKPAKRKKPAAAPAAPHKPVLIKNGEPISASKSSAQ